ncbi:MAG: Ig-like domain-containing protein [Erysipelotrichaceae bacterium]|nr:Ig-like domain-containing protein [Erysipelotrichaceae bacterium]
MFKKIIAGLTTLILVSAIAIIVAQPRTIAKESEQNNLLVVQNNIVNQTVNQVKPESVTPQLSYLQLNASKNQLTIGDAIQMKVTANIPSLIPEDLVYSVDSLIATIDQDGYLFALSAGEVTVHVSSKSVRLESAFKITISEPVVVVTPVKTVTPTPKPAPVTVAKPTPAPVAKPAPAPAPVTVANISVTGITLKSSVDSLYINKTTTLADTVSPTNATDKSVTWQTSNADIATVSTSGLVSAKSTGEVTITVTSKDGGFKDSVTLTIKSAVSMTPQSDWKLEVARLTNIEREKAGKSILKYNNYIAAGAQIRSEELVVSFSHTRPDGSRFFTVFDDPDFTYRYIGENLALGYKSPAEVVAAWMKSEGHRKNLLSDNYSDIGVGITKGENGRYHWAQIFYKGK